MHPSCSSPRFLLSVFSLALFVLFFAACSPPVSSRQEGAFFDRENGETVYRNYRNGHLRECYPVNSRNEKHGPYRSYYDDGTICTAGSYVHGKPCGWFYTYTPRYELLRVEQYDTVYAMDAPVRSVGCWRMPDGGYWITETIYAYGGLWGYRKLRMHADGRVDWSNSRLYALHRETRKDGVHLQARGVFTPQDTAAMVLFADTAVWSIRIAGHPGRKIAPYRFEFDLPPDAYPPLDTLKGFFWPAMRTSRANDSLIGPRYMFLTVLSRDAYQEEILWNLLDRQWPHK